MRRPVRVSKNVAQTDAFRVCINSGKNTGAYAVIEQTVIGAGGVLGRLRFTNLERTLIDIAVRPVYSGGIGEVAKAYELARENASINVLAATLQKLRYIYPYHQVIGFYLERAGYKTGQLDLLRRFPMEFDFYLSHAGRDMRYVEDWRLHVPRDF